MSTSPPRTRAEKPPKVTSTVARSSGLATSRLASRVRRAVGGPGPADAEVGESRPAEVLDDGERSGAQDLQGCHGYLLGSDGPELDPHALRQQRRIGPVEVPQDRVGVADELPAAGRSTGIYRAEFAGEGDRTGRHRGPRLRAARHPQPRVAVDQVRETRCEAAESDPPQGGGVGVDHLRGGQPGVVGDLGEVRAVVDDVDHDVGAAVRAVATASAVTRILRSR